MDAPDAHHSLEGTQSPRREQSQQRIVLSMGRVGRWTNGLELLWEQQEPFWEALSSAHKTFLVGSAPCWAGWQLIQVLK